MKKRALLLAVSALIVGYAIATNQAMAAERAEVKGFPAGQFSLTTQGSLAICLNPGTFAEESCSTSGVLVVPLSALGNGATTFDSQGNSCATATEVDSNLPVDASPPFVTANEHTVGNPLDYDPTTGTGNSSITGYTGGACNGATFDSTGATELFSGTVHFVVSENGNRVDSIITKLTNPTNSIGDFSLSGTNLRQIRP